MKKKLYVGCPLRHAPEEFIEQVEKLKNGLRKDFDVLDFVGRDIGTPEEVFQRDTEQVRMCDCFLAICDLPSLGLGYEIALALELEKPTPLAVAHEDADVSRMVLGIAHQNFAFKRYGSVDDIHRVAREVFF